MYIHRIKNDLDVRVYVNTLHDTRAIEDQAFRFFLYTPSCDLVPIDPALYGVDDAGAYVVFNLSGNAINQQGIYDVRIQLDSPIDGVYTEVLEAFSGVVFNVDTQALPCSPYRNCGLITLHATLGGQAPVRPACAPLPCFIRLNDWLYAAKVDAPVKPHTPGRLRPFGCTSFNVNGHYYRNFDLGYDDSAEVYVKTPICQGIATIPGLTRLSQVSRLTFAQAPYYMVDGTNRWSLCASTHLVFNDAAYESDPNGFPAYQLVYTILSDCKTLNEAKARIQAIKSFSIPASFYDAGYSVHWLFAQDSEAFTLRLTADGPVIVDLAASPYHQKLTNFWADGQAEPGDDTRPTGLERYVSIQPGVGQIPSLEELRFTQAYTTQTRLSEFIGLRGTTYYDLNHNTGALLDIQADAADMYANRQRDGQTWQTLHSVEYADGALQSLFVQEDYTKDYAPLINQLFENETN